MATFIAMTSWQGEFTDDFLARPAPDPAQFGLPTEDDGRRDDPLLSGTANAITRYRPDVEVLGAAPTRVVIAVGIESHGHPDRAGRPQRPREALGQQVDRLPEPPRWVPRRRVRLGRGAGGVRRPLREVLDGGE